MTEGQRTGEHVERIERIVRDVLSRLGGTQRSTERETTDVTDGTDCNRKVERQQTCQILTAKVITTSVLPGKLQGIGEVHVEATAVVTPAAAELLRHAAIRLVRVGRGGLTGAAEACRLVVAVAECPIEPASIVRLAEVHRGDIQHVARMGLVEVVMEMTEQVVLGGSKGLLFTDRPAAALCLANRSQGVRAVEGNRVEGAASDIASVGANVLVIRPRRLSSWQQLQMVRAFLACRAACPIELDATLG